MKQQMEDYGDKVRWTNTEHMLSDLFTKHLADPTLFEKFMRDMTYGFVTSESKRDRLRKALEGNLRESTKGEWAVEGRSKKAGTGKFSAGNDVNAMNSEAAGSQSTNF